MVIIQRVKNLLNGIKENRKKVQVINAINELKVKKYRYAIMNKETKRIVYSSKTYFKNISMCKQHANAIMEYVYNSEYNKYVTLYYPIFMDDELNGVYEVCENGIRNL